MPARKPKKLPVIPPIEEVEQLLRATTRQRDRLILMLMAFMGLRASEVVNLDAGDFDARRGQLFLRQAKGHKDAVLPAPTFLQGPLRGWRGSRTAGPMFTSRKANGRLTTRALRYLVKRVAMRAGLPNASKSRVWYPHVLRHSFCTEKIRRRVPLPYVQRLMRHERIQTTLRYCHLVPEDLRLAMET